MANTDLLFAPPSARLPDIVTTYEVYLPDGRRYVSRIQSLARAREILIEILDGDGRIVELTETRRTL